jgi:hypothetical protein
MLLPMLVTLLATQTPQTPAVPEQLVISAVVLDQKGRPVTDLKPEEFVIEESGTVRPVLRAELDGRPLTVALVLDASVAMGTTYAADVIPAAVAFLKRLPSGSTFSIWTTSDRPKLVVEDGTDLKAAEDKLRQQAPAGNNAAVDTVVAASQHVVKAEGRRTAVVLVTSATMGEVRADVQALLPQAALKPTYVVVEVLQGQQDARLEDFLKVLVSRTAGFHERVFSTMAIDTQLRKGLDVLSAGYRLAWRPGMDPRQAKIVIKVKRPNTKVTQALRLSTAW